jgi:predicted ATPase
VSPADVGFGISQSLPVIVQLVTSRNAVIAVEQPEIHIHPGLQTRLADLIIESTARETAANQVLIETHSEHLMLRLQRRVREGKLSPNDLSVLYVDWNGDEQTAEVVQLPLDAEGSFLEPWPRGFFAERYDEIFGNGNTLAPLPSANEDDLP